MQPIAPVDLVITGGLVVNATNRREATVVIHDGLVVDLLDSGDPVPEARRTVDASGRIVMPGGVDPHCHIGQRLGDVSMLDDYREATIAALWGGTTTVVDFAIPDRGQTPLEAVHARRKLAESARCDTALHGAVVDWDSTTSAQLRSMAELGVLTSKMFTTYREGVMAGPDTILEVMKTLDSIGGIAYVHAEENHVIEAAQEEAASHGSVHSRHHPSTRPESAELDAVRVVLAMAEATGAAVYFVHQTTAEAVQLVTDARRRGVRAYSETCPHYLVLDESVYESEHPERFVCCPPLRAADSVRDLMARAAAGDIDTLGSDHCCYSTQQKEQSAHDVREMPNGLPGVESRLAVGYTALVVENGVSLEQFVAMFAANPARLNGLRSKGWIGPGADADIAIVDPAVERTISAATHHMASDYSPYEGRAFLGWPTTVVSRGVVVVDDDGFHDPGAVGRPLRARAQLDGHRHLASTAPVAAEVVT